MGLALREIETDPDRVQALKNDIHRKFGKGGVHTAELVQKGIVTELVGQLAKILGNPADVTNKLVTFLEQVDDLAIFVSRADTRRVQRLCELAKARVDNAPSRMVIIFGSGYATSVVMKILKCIREDPEEYAIELKEEGPQLVHSFTLLT